MGLLVFDFTKRIIPNEEKLSGNFIQQAPMIY